MLSKIWILHLYQGRRNGFESTVSSQLILKISAVSKVFFPKKNRFDNDFSKIYSVLGHCGHCADAGPDLYLYIFY